ncbi:MAG: DUF362 domain-containing protein [Spirochaetota bacterium]
MKRRDFLKAAAGTGFYLAARRLFPQAGETYDVGVAVGTDYPKAVEQAIDLAGGIRRFVKPGDTVVVKPNMAWNSPPELKANTDPVIVRTVVHLCFQALAGTVLVFDRSCNNPRLVYVTSGIMEAAREAGAKVLYVNDVTKKLYPSITIPGATFLEETTVNRHVLEADAFINLPVAKDHGSAGLTIGMKNLMGITGDNRSRWHWKLHEAISDINLGVKPHLTVVDATNIMVRNGPTGGRPEYLKRTDTVIASPDVVAADTEAAGLFDRDLSRVEHLSLGAGKGVGRMSGYTRKVVRV